MTNRQIKDIVPKAWAAKKSELAFRRSLIDGYCLAFYFHTQNGVSHLTEMKMVVGCEKPAGAGFGQTCLEFGVAFKPIRQPFIY